jgi:hypothetical protein
MHQTFLPPLDDEATAALADYLLANPRLNRTIGRDFPDAGHFATKPGNIPNQVAKDAQANLCWYNARDAAKATKGSVVFGWALWQMPVFNRACHVAQHHAVVRPAGSKTLIDVTPQDELYVGNTIVFMADPRVGFDFEADPLQQPPMLVRLDVPEPRKSRYFWVYYIDDDFRLVETPGAWVGTLDNFAPVPMR